MSDPGSLELSTTNDPDLWDGVLEEIGDYDFYYLSSYHRLAELRGEVNTDGQSS